MMRSLAPSAVVLAVAAFAVPVQAHDVFYGATLSGANESPPNGSLGTGTALVTFNDDDFTMRVQVSFSGLTGTTTASHIHCCTPSPGAGTAGVATQTPTFIDFPLGVTSSSYDHTFDLTDPASWNSAYVTANGGTVSTAFAAFSTGLALGEAYLNIHTTFVGSGEIRGFLVPVPEPATYGLMAAGLAAIGLAARRRQRTAA